MPDDYSEDSLIEQPAIELFRSLGWQTENCLHEFDTIESPLGRKTKSEVVLIERLKEAIKKLNPNLPLRVTNRAIEELLRERPAMSLGAANREIYKLLKEGIKVEDKVNGGEKTIEVVRLIDWDNPQKNDFLLCSQFWVTGDMYTRRADLVGFVNGIPLILIELKAVHKNIKDAYDNNLRDYKDTIPRIFWYNALIILSNGGKAKIGSVTAEWEHFSDWKKINSEGEKGVISLDTMIRGTCEPSRLLDIVENFTLFKDAAGGTIKLLAMNHQYLGVNNVIEKLINLKENRGKLGVFWHTQGSGKSISMIFFAQKVLRQMPGHWTFVIVTDRIELDDQIYKNFADCGVITEKYIQADSGEHLKQLIREDHRYIFTLIHKFNTRSGDRYPVLSERSDIIVITDEAHRTQYDTLAMNMRTALPNAAFIGFTGTPLMAGEEKTREVFGDYVSIYNFQQSIEDKATVPLFYENRIPELQLTNENLNEDMEELFDSAELTEAQERKIEREFSKEYHLITRDDRLETIAKDIVEHYLGRDRTGEAGAGKAMVVCIDKATAVKMYDKVQKYWKQHLQNLISERKIADEFRSKQIDEEIKFIKETDMAVVVSQSQNEIADMRAKGLDITPHRERMMTEDLDKKFKDPDDPFRMVFVCAMWMTGFDVPCCSTIYLDKPMRNHTLMQTIARANRVFRDKVNGLIVDYVGVFRDLQRALAIYAPSPKDRERPIKDKKELVEALKSAIVEVEKFCAGKGIDLKAIQQAKDFDKVALIENAVDEIIVNDESKKKYLQLASDVERLFTAIKPDPIVSNLAPDRKVILILAAKIRSLSEPVDISEIMKKVEKLLDESVAAEAYIIREKRADEDKTIDLSKIDFKKLQKQFEEGKKRIEAEKLRRMLGAKLYEMIKLNRTRMDFQEKFQKMIDDYNAGSLNVKQFFDRLIKFAEELKEEEARHIAKNLSEEELAIFDLLMKPKIRLTPKEEHEVKKVAKELLAKLKKEKLVLDWRKKQQARAEVLLVIENILEKLPNKFTPPVYRQKCAIIYQHIYDSYYGSGAGVYAGQLPPRSYV